MTKFILILALVSRVFAATYNYYGCFASSSVNSLTSRGTYQFQSTSYCREECGDTDVAAMSGGNACFCGSSVPSSSDKVSESFCNEPCDGYPLEICGGTNYLSVYVNEDADDDDDDDDDDDETTSSTSSTSSSSSSSSSSSTSSTTSTSSFTSRTSSSLTTASSTSSSSSSSSSTNSPSPTSSASSSTTSSSSSQQVSVIIVTTSAERSGSVEVVTTVITALDNSQETGSSSSSNSDSTANRGSNSGSSLSKGAIAGTVIGSVIGGVLIIVALAFWWWRRRKSDIESDLEADNEKKEAAVSDFVRSYAVPPSHVAVTDPSTENDQVSLRPNNALTRRFSHGSLPDVTQDSYDPSPGLGGLRIINPDNPTDDEV
ncbi:Stress-activated PKC1-MPK1 signaling pathway sensor-transducer [Komagataella phaffii CBS 7435]|uniref:WSC domain-containing protein n=2 Tax=Komagataella phaffii TaxID=460519 RepID=C4QYE1_KOMPG|nr:uncharacterized protein PAS_chr1-4_0415 [Komagataella phaffii GS115]AOA61044.1 GQ67_01747T0 [Komagataella phaffii]CAH2447087.1 Stress-activated PKC1-MPK1 signaling pathway sensor-transducer [Komagataella phaffii CBS 7435]AOA65415.1 GQ68_01762T0 [Komagataella phaffii GS115]CAY68264.1 hypothetical protein PAS_chr1-4_0415 [Komagataella phaffii GS115]CCA37334.1 Stress-activated PKC1-MPK1 signaling pathway sensor-transducer [Komagataella phaffii CBS 7435]